MPRGLSKGKKAVSLLVTNPTMSVTEAMRQAGYSESSANTQLLTRTKTFQDIIGGVSDGDLVQRLRDIALDPFDKRASLQAIDMILKLKDRYPAGKLRVQQLNEEIERISVDELIHD